MKNRKRKLQKNLDKIQKSGFLSESSMKVYKDDLKHITIVLNEKQEILKVEEESSRENKISIFFLSKEKLSKENLKKLIKDITPKFIEEWRCYSYSNSSNYQRIEVYY